MSQKVLLHHHSVVFLSMFPVQLLPLMLYLFVFVLTNLPCIWALSSVHKTVSRAEISGVEPYDESLVRHEILPNVAYEYVPGDNIHLQRWDEGGILKVASGKALRRVFSLNIIDRDTRVTVLRITVDTNEHRIDLSSYDRSTPIRSPTPCRRTDDQTEFPFSFTGGGGGPFLFLIQRDVGVWRIHIAAAETVKSKFLELNCLYYYKAEEPPRQSVQSHNLSVGFENEDDVGGLSYYITVPTIEVADPEVIRTEEDHMRQDRKEKQSRKRRFEERQNAQRERIEHQLNVDMARIRVEADERREERIKGELKDKERRLKEEKREEQRKEMKLREDDLEQRLRDQDEEVKQDEADKEKKQLDEDLKKITERRKERMETQKQVEEKSTEDRVHRKLRNQKEMLLKLQTEEALKKANEEKNNKLKQQIQTLVKQARLQTVTEEQENARKTKEHLQQLEEEGVNRNPVRLQAVHEEEDSIDKAMTSVQEAEQLLRQSYMLRPTLAEDTELPQSRAHSSRAHSRAHSTSQTPLSLTEGTITVDTVGGGALVREEKTKRRKEDMSKQHPFTRRTKRLSPRSMRRESLSKEMKEEEDRETVKQQRIDNRQYSPGILYELAHTPSPPRDYQQSPRTVSVDEGEKIAQRQNIVEQPETDIFGKINEVFESSLDQHNSHTGRRGNRIYKHDSRALHIDDDDDDDGIHYAKDDTRIKQTDKWVEESRTTVGGDDDGAVVVGEMPHPIDTDGEQGQTDNEKQNKGGKKVKTDIRESEMLQEESNGTTTVGHHEGAESSSLADKDRERDNKQDGLEQPRPVSHGRRSIIPLEEAVEESNESEQKTGKRI
eukprot:GHVQ01025784.1.p1 GENE.GHVQ01025784.1~~GHVQ01025784.1.p1  ORF type:complete len:834 (+),score=212.44 GHVQ01025784.1:176-2677(+)